MCFYFFRFFAVRTGFFAAGFLAVFFRAGADAFRTGADAGFGAAGFFGGSAFLGGAGGASLLRYTMVNRI